MRAKVSVYFIAGTMKVVMQAAPGGGLQPRLLPGAAALARGEGMAVFHGRENADQAGLEPASAQALAGEFLLAHAPVGQEFDLQLRGGGQRLRPVAQGLGNGLGESLEFKTAQTQASQFPRERSRVAELPAGIRR